MNNDDAGHPDTESDHVARITLTQAPDDPESFSVNFTIRVPEVNPQKLAELCRITLDTLAALQSKWNEERQRNIESPSH
ncbi:MAG: hypothetical protein K0S28_1053 [Paucimonas sp.]|nr:hypothetical protein [Paucimonas sp.]